MPKKDKTGKGDRVAAGIGFGVLTGLGVALLGAMLGAFLISGGKMGEDAVDLMALTVTGVAAMAGAWLAVMVAKEKRMQVCLLTGLGFYLALLSLTALFFEGQYQGLGLSAILIGLCSGVVGLLSAKGRKSKKPW